MLDLGPSRTPSSLVRVKGGNDPIVRFIQRRPETEGLHNLRHNISKEEDRNDAACVQSGKVT